MKKFINPNQYFSFILLIVICASTTYAQEDGPWRFSQGLSGRHIQGIHLQDEEHILVVGGNEHNDSIATISFTDDGAYTWFFNYDRPSPILLDIDFSSDQTGYIVGWGGTIKKSTNSGEDWLDIELPGNFPQRDFNACWFFNDQEGLVVGGNEFNDAIQTIIKTSDGGQNWNIIRDNLAPWLFDVSFYDENVGLAVGDQNAILRTTNGGDSWVEISPPMGMNPRRLNSVLFKDINTCYIVGGNPSLDSIQTVLMSQDGGLSWSIVTDGLGYMLNDIAFANDDLGFVVGDEGLLWSTEDGGNSWNEVALSKDVNDTIRDLRAIEFLSEDYGLLGGQWGKMIVYDTRVTLSPPFVQTLGANILSPTSAELFGQVNPSGLETRVYFDYGIGIDLGSSVEITNSPLNGQGFIAVSEVITNLEENNDYFYSIRAVNADGEAVGDTLSFSSDLSIIPNWDFELWDSVIYTSPDNWFSLGDIQIIESHDSSQAIEIRGNDNTNGFGVIMKGRFGQMGPEGGVPFTSRPDSLSGYFKYDLVTDDAALVWLILKDGNGQAVADSLYMITGSSGGIYERLNFGINYTSPNPVDTLLLIITSSNPFGNPSNNSVVQLDNLEFSPGSDAINNGDFESFSQDVIMTAKSWMYRGKGSKDRSFVERSETRQSGDYALRLNNNTDDYARVGLSEEYNKPVFPVSKRYNTFNGYLIFNQESNDSLQLSVNMYKDGQSVGNAYQLFAEDILDFEDFEMEFSYMDAFVIPDSMNIQISIFNRSNSNRITDSYLIIDNLSFDGLLLKVKETGMAQPLIFPNPTSGHISIVLPEELQATSYVIIKVLDINGKEVLKEKKPIFQTSITIDLGQLVPGIYLLQIDHEDVHYSKKILLEP